MNELTTDIRYTIVPDELVRDDEVGGYAKLIYLCIATHMSKDRSVAWPGRDRIMKLSGFRKQVVDRAVRELEEHGWLTVKRDFGCVNQYQVNQSARRTSPRDGQGVSARRTGTSPRGGPEGKPLKVNQEESMCVSSSNPSPPSSSDPKSFGAYWENRSFVAGPIDYPLDFDRFWESYPRSVNKKGTLRRWARTLKKGGATVEQLQTAAMAYRKIMVDKRGTETQYLKHSTTFLGTTEPWRDFIGQLAPDPIGEQERYCPHCGERDTTGGRDSECLACGRRFDEPV